MQFYSLASRLSIASSDFRQHLKSHILLENGFCSDLSLGIAASEAIVHVSLAVSKKCTGYFLEFGILLTARILIIISTLVVEIPLNTPIRQ